MGVTPDEFRAALSRFASGVTVVTTIDASGRRHGITVSSFCSVSLEPPLVLICIEKATASHYAFGESLSFVVNVLRLGQEALSEKFASQADDKFDGVEFTSSASGIPILAGCLATLECSIEKVLDGGDHSIFLAEVRSARVSEGEPLLYFHGDYHAMAAGPGHRASSKIQ
jgi:flavin reductase ActVB